MYVITHYFEKDGNVSWIGDAHHKGADVYFSERRKQWVVVDLENREVNFADRLVVYRSAKDGDETGLNQTCVACDLDGQYGYWVVPHDKGDEIELVDGVYLEWDSEAK